MELRARIITMAAAATIALGAAGAALAGHTVCDNEPIPHDLPVNIGNPPVVHVGVDTGTNNGAVSVCTNVQGQGGHATLDRDDTATPGQTVDAAVCPGGTCTITVGSTGAEAGTVGQGHVTGVQGHVAGESTGASRRTGVDVNALVVPPSVQDCGGCGNMSHRVNGGRLRVWVHNAPDSPAVSVPLCFELGQSSPPCP